MCEFKVYLDEVKVMEDVIYAEVNERNVSLKDIIGETMIFENVRIVEVNVPAAKLVLKRH